MPMILPSQIIRKRILSACVVSICLLVMLSACTQQSAARHRPIVVEIPSKQRLQQRWVASISATSTSSDLSSQPVAMGGALYTIDKSGEIDALRAHDGHLIWQVHLPENASSPLTLDGERLYVGGERGNFYAFSRRNGKVLWHSPLPNQAIARSVVSGNRVFVKTIDGTLSAYHTRYGTLLWRYHRPSPSLVLRSGGAPSVKAGIVLSGFSDGSVVAFKSKNGEVLWESALGIPAGSTELERLVDVTAAPVINGRVVYAASYQGELQALDLYSGALLWSHELNVKNDMSLQGRSLYVTDTAGSVWSFITDEDGAVEWMQPKLGKRHLTSPLIKGGNIFIADNAGDIIVLARDDGHIAGVQEVGDAFVSNPILAEGHIILQNQSGKLMAFDYG